ncbi:retrovirus-related pol polyprotein from transposon TNT 1-94, partial [Tanacetum coccineum]
EKMLLVQAQESGQILDEEQLAFLADPGVPDGQAVQIIILSNVTFQTDDLYVYDSDYNQSVQAMQYFKQTPIDAYPDNEITSESNIIMYSQYLLETQQAAVQDTNSSIQQDSMILYVIEQMSEQMINHVTNWDNANKKTHTESLTAKLERYKERVKTFEQRLNINLSSREKLIDSQMDDMIQDRLALKQQIDSLEQNLSNQIKKKEPLLQTFTVFKNDSKEKENKYMEKEIDLEKKVMELANIKAQWIKPTLYDGSVISRQHDVIHVTGEEVTLILEELNQLSEDFEKRFVLQQELSAEQAFGLQTSNSNTKQSDTTPVKIKAPSELPKVSLVNTNLKKLKYHLASVDTVVEKRITPDAITEGSWGFEHTKDLLNEITEVQTVFNHMEAAVQQCSVDKKCFEIHKKELFLNNDRLLHQIMSQDVMLTVMNSIAVFGDYVNLNMKKSETCNKFLDLEVELVKKKNMVERDVYTELSNNLKGQIQEKVYVTTTLRNELRILKGKNVLDNAATITNATTIAPRMFKLDLEPLSRKLLNNREAHIDYLKHTQEYADTPREITEEANTIYPLDSALDFACKYVTRIQELLVYVKDTCPNVTKPSKKLVAVTPPNKNKKVRFAKPATSSRVTQQQAIPRKTRSRNQPVATRRIKKKTTLGKLNLSENPQEELSLLLVVQIVLWYLDSGCSKHMTGNRSQLINFVSKFLGNVYYVEGLGHNLFSVRQYYDSDIEVAFRRDTCHIRDLDGVDLLKGSRGSNLYTLSLDNVMSTSPICLLSKASKTKSWLWHQRLSHLNFDYSNKLTKQGMVCGLPRLKFLKDHLCFACALGKIKKHSHKPKAEYSIQKKLYLLHMDLCGPMRIQSINGKKYILVIVDDYSRFTWVKFLRSKDECLSIRHSKPTMETLGSHTKHCLHAPLFLWAEAVATACYTQNRSLIRKRHNKTPYELLHNKKPDLSYLHVFGALCYPTNDSDDIGKLQPKADIGIFVRYALANKAFRIYNKSTRVIIETIHVDFDELTIIASEQFSSGPGFNLLASIY